MRNQSLIFALAGMTSALSAQVVTPNQLGVAMGHYHLMARDPDAQERFWIEVIGAKPAKLKTTSVLMIPGAIIFIHKGKPSAGTVGSPVNHIGFKVRDLKATVAKAESARWKIEPVNEQQVMVIGPDAVKVELTADPTMEIPLVNHHIHFYTPEVEPMRKWYADLFGAVPGKRGKFEAADLPAVNLSFSKAPGEISGTKGRSLDHIGFEVRDLKSFAKKLEGQGIRFDVPYRELPSLGLGIAFFTDPWGTYIELTEGLSQVK